MSPAAPFRSSGFLPTHRSIAGPSAGITIALVAYLHDPWASLAGRGAANMLHLLLL